MDCMTSLWNARYLRIAGLAIGAVAVGGVAIAITASAAGMTFGFKPTASNTSPTPSPTKPGAAGASTVCSDFMSHFATDVGKSQAQINAAFQKAIGETLADEVKSGQITQAQADAIKKKLANQTPCTLAPATTRPKGGETKPGFAYMQYYLSAAAAALGLKDDQLTADLKNGQSISQIAAAQNPPITEDEFRARVIANLKPVLDKSVANKLLTATQEQMILNELQTGPLPLWNAAPVTKPRPPATVTPSPKAA